MHQDFLSQYKKKEKVITEHLVKFQKLPKENYFDEFLFCLLTPQSNAQRCWSAVKEIKKLKSQNQQSITSILKTRTRFHNTKAMRILEAKKNFSTILPHLSNPDRISLRNHIANEVSGYGLKEASHFLRNIGKSDNQIAILDRHILKNLKSLGIITYDKIKSKNHYLQTEQAFLEFSKSISIPIDHLDLLFWSQENGEIFK